MTTAAITLVENTINASSQTPAPHRDPSLRLPRILCLHGGGTNARIFRTQCRVIRAHLAPYFRLVFPDAPFFSQPGPDVESVYAKWGPFRSWLRPGSGSACGFALLDAAEADVAGISQSIAAAMQSDNEAGATGKWVGLLGFSQGAKMAASLLLRQQDRRCYSRIKVNVDRDWQSRMSDTDYRFAVLLAGRAPLVEMNTDIVNSIAFAMDDTGLLRLPTIHMHGLRDAGLSMHRDLLHHCCEKGTTRLIEWDGDHRVPIKTKDVTLLVAEILDVANETGS